MTIGFLGAGKMAEGILSAIEDRKNVVMAEKVAEREAAAAKAAEQKRAMDEDKPLINQAKKQASDKKRRHNCGVVVKGDPDLLVHLAHCCNPVAGDEIVGFITRGRGVSVHRASCPNVTALMEQIRETVHERFGVWLEPEVKII